jgi:choline dehydrogenase
LAEHRVIIVGAGTAGCVLARRLLERTHARVLVVEAGPRYPGWALGAPLAGLRLRRRWSWATESVPQSQLGGRRIPLPMGRVVGGSSAVNAMVAAAGPPADYDAWAAAGNEGWAWADLAPCWEQVASAAGGGLLPVAAPRYESAFSAAFLGACAELGIGRRQPLTGAEAETCGTFSLFQERGARVTAARCLSAARLDERLTVLPRTPVCRVVMEGGRAVGVELGGPRRAKRIVAADAVILCAGAVFSPHLLQLSGIGPAETLEAAGLAVRMHLPGVGLNLQDHAGVPLVVESAVPPPGRPSRWLAAAIRHVVSGTGVMASNCCEAACFLAPPGGSADAAPGIEVYTHFQTGRHPRAVEFSVVLMHPRSRGTVRPNPAAPWSAPLVDPRILTEEPDRITLVAGVERVRSIVATRALRGFGLGREILPGGPPGCPPDDAFLRDHAATYHHPVGTCRMGGDALAVVDPRLRVHGTENLWVVDNSVVPTIPAGHTAATALIIAERAADFLAADLARH